MSADQLFPDTEIGRLYRATDWASTPLGPVEAWPQALKTLLALVLRQGMPQSLCWGPDLLQLYNDAYCAIMGDKHPSGLGKPVLENWAEVRGDVAPLFARVLDGETVYFEDLPLRVFRDGRVRDLNFTVSYSPLFTDAGRIGGAFINCVETTDQVAGRTAQAERDRLVRALDVEQQRLWQVFRQSPSFFAILRGPDNVFEMINAAYEQIIGHGRNVIGKPLFEALPETRGQQFDEYLGRVRQTGEPLVLRDLPAVLERTPGGAPEQRFIDITYLPLVEADGSHTAVIAHGTDVTDHVRARLAVEHLLADTERARAEAERIRADLADANARLQDQQMELELTNQQLQDGAADMESQTEELRAIATSLAQRTAEAETARGTVAAIVEAVTDGFVAFDSELRYTYVNRRAADMWGLSRDDLIGKRPSELWTGMDGSPFVSMLHRVLTSRRAEVLEEYASSLHIPIELRAYPSADGGLVVFFADLTEQRRAGAAATFLAEASRLLASSAEYQSTLSNLARAAVPRLGDWCAVDVLVDPDSAAWPPRIERVAVVHQDPSKISLATKLTTAFPQDWARDTGTPRVLRTREPLLVADVTDDMLVGGAQSPEHLALLRELQFRSIIIAPLVARDRVLGTFTLVMAESQRRFTESDLALAVDLGRRAGVAIDNARLLRDADEANAAKTAFLRTISHELRQPLNAIRGYVDLWRMGLRGAMSPTMAEDVERLARNQEHLSVLIEDLLSFTRLDAGQLTVERVAVPIVTVFAALEAMVEPQMAERGIHFSYERCDPMIAVLGDADRITQVGVNLLTNAMRATPAGGHVALACIADAASVTIAVTDTGVGIPPDKLESIFSPFTQLGRSLNAPKEGAGLGLAISRGLVEAMGGTLTVTSNVGEGSVFAFCLPRASDPR